MDTEVGILAQGSYSLLSSNSFLIEKSDKREWISDKREWFSVLKLCIYEYSRDRKMIDRMMK